MYRKIASFVAYGTMIVNWLISILMFTAWWDIPGTLIAIFVPVGPFILPILFFLRTGLSWGFAISTALTVVMFAALIGLESTKPQEPPDIYSGY